jgi:DNA-binding PadR family transcriptional regulator
MHLRLLILNLLKEAERTGYDLIKIIEKELKWKPSPGSIYPI